jgi:hypothetical protein
MCRCTWLATVLRSACNTSCEVKHRLQLKVKISYAAISCSETFRRYVLYPPSRWWNVIQLPWIWKLRVLSKSLNFLSYIIIIIIIIIIIGIQPLGLSGQRPELSQATGIALVRCILGKFLGVVCHCFPPIQHNITKNCHWSKNHRKRLTNYILRDVMNQRPLWETFTRPREVPNLYGTRK